MKKSITWILLAGLFIVGCGSENDKDTLSSIISNKDIVKVTIQFHDNYVDITDKDDVEQILQMFSDNEKSNDNETKDDKGWIYNLSCYDKNDKEKAQICVLSENSIKCKDEIYTCKYLSLTTIDNISKIDRYN